MSRSSPTRIDGHHFFSVLHIGSRRVWSGRNRYLLQYDCDDGPKMSQFINLDELVSGCQDPNRYICVSIESLPRVQKIVGKWILGLQTEEIPRTIEVREISSVKRDGDGVYGTHSEGERTTRLSMLCVVKLQLYISETCVEYTKYVFTVVLRRTRDPTKIETPEFRCERTEKGRKEKRHPSVWNGNLSGRIENKDIKEWKEEKYVLKVGRDFCFESLYLRISIYRHHHTGHLPLLRPCLLVKSLGSLVSPFLYKIIYLTLSLSYFIFCFYVTSPKIFGFYPRKFYFTCLGTL